MKVKVRLEHSDKNNEYYAYDEHGFICGTLGCNKEKLEQMIKECNEHSELLALNRELVRVLKSLEWDSEAYCPMWGSFGGDHRIDCELGAVLEDAKVVLG